MDACVLRRGSIFISQKN